MRAFPAIILVLAVTAGIAGWLTTPRYRPPADSGEGRLLMRAAEYYQASRVLDYKSMSMMYTPARQLAEADELRAEAARKAAAFLNFDPETRAGMEFSASSIEPDRLEPELAGDWAAVSGSCDISLDSGPLSVPLEGTVWVRDAGEWWIYFLTVEELNAYGNPPDFARRTLNLREPEMVEQQKPQ